MPPSERSANEGVVSGETFIDAEWVMGLLAPKYPGTTVDLVEIRQTVVGMSVMYPLVLRFSANPHGLPSAMMLKGGFGRNGPEYDWIYETEMIAYRDFLPTVDVRAPLTFFAGRDRSRGGAIILMEDLSELGTRFNDARHALNYRQAAAFLDNFARFHARYWNSPELSANGQFAWLVPLLSGFVIDQHFRSNTSSAIWEKYLALPRGAAVPRRFRSAERMWDALSNLADFHQAFPQTVIHGDGHFGNSYLSADGEPGLVDWQIRRGPWFQDVTYFLVSALDPLDRRDWDIPLIQYYLGRLAVYGVTPPSLDEALFCYRAEIAYGLINFITNGDLKGEYLKEYQVVGFVCRFVQAASDHDSLSLT